jgi:hypothetical protein
MRIPAQFLMLYFPHGQELGQVGGGVGESGDDAPGMGYRVRLISSTFYRMKKRQQKIFNVSISLVLITQSY